MKLLLSLFTGLMLAGCSSTNSTQSMPNGIFTLTPQQADSVIVTAIKQQWPDKQLKPLPDKRIGYIFSVWWAIDHDHISVEAIPEGKESYSFSVTNSGTAPLSGNSAREDLLPLLIENATKAQSKNQ